jgi:KipI family sensor histidine kinase inhibitor
VTRRVVRPLGDGAVIADVGTTEEAHALARALRADPAWPAAEVVVGERAVTLVADPDATDLGALAARLRDGWPSRRDEEHARPGVRTVRIPVCFVGPDLEDVASAARITPGAVVEQLQGATLSVSFVGFLPGFAYLEGLPPALAAVPRRAAPRASVAAGSVALAGGFAGVYPHASPGGWNVVGHTGFPLFDPDTPPFSTLAPGDAVRFVATEDAGRPAPAVPRPTLSGRGRRQVHVDAPGMLTTVQDLGRNGVAHLGVPRAGAADPDALRAANRLVGNDDGAAALEVTASGPRLTFRTDAHVAVTGDTEFLVDGRALTPGTVVPVSAGQVVAVGTVRGDLRAYMAVAGGIAIAPLLGSRSSDMLSGLGPGPLRAGDVLDLGVGTRPHGRLLAGGAGASVARSSPTRRTLRVMVGPDEAGKATSQLLAREWEVHPASDRMGVRLSGHAVDIGNAVAASRGMVTGAVQVPPDGQPVVLLCDHATVGGYPVLATVVRADAGVVGRCRPGDVVAFRPVDAAEAARARAAARRALENAVVGWYPGRVD